MNVNRIEKFLVKLAVSAIMKKKADVKTTRIQQTK